MNKFRSLSLVLLALFAFVVSAGAQTALTQTTLAAAVTSTSNNRVTLTSTTGVSVNTLLYIDNEALSVESLVGGGAVQVQRGANGTRASFHVNGAGVLAGPANAFVTVNPQGACTAGSGVFGFTPVVNVTNGLQFLCGINGRVAPGFGNTSIPPNSTAAVASAAGVVVPTGPLFHITGALAITGFTLPVGFDPKSGNTVCVVPDGAFTTTNAGNIAIASTGVVSKTLCFSYDPAAAKPFFPSY